MTFQIPIGDWSDDGHGKCEMFRASAEGTIDDLREAYFHAVEMFKEDGVSPESFCAEYEDSEVSPELAAFFAKHGLFPGLADEGFDIEKMAQFVAWFLNQGNPALCVTLIPIPDEPMLPFYGVDKQERHIGHLGYGLLS